MDRTKRMTAKKVQELVDMTGLELEPMTYVAANQGCACNVGIMAAAEYGITNAEKNIFVAGCGIYYGTEKNLSAHQKVADAYGMPLAYVVGIEAGFEHYDDNSVSSEIDTTSEDYKLGKFDGMKIRHAWARGRIRPPAVKQEDIRVEDLEDITFGETPLEIHGNAIAEGSAWRS